MPYLDRDFDLLIQEITNKKRLNYTGVDPVFYLIYPPKDILTVKRKLTQWQAKLTNAGFVPEVLSVADCIEETVQKYSLYEEILESEKADPMNFAEINSSIKSILQDGKTIYNQILEKLALLSDNQVLLVTDLEALHPYLHVSALEADLQGKVKAPVIILYPGSRAGQSSLKFLGIHPQLGNYRSVHIGGWQ